MARKSFVLLIVGAMVFFLGPVSSADVPDKISYQGKLATAQGGCLNDTVQMTFSIYPDTTGSPADWTETQTEVIVKEGIFNVLLGSEAPIPASVFDGSTKYLGVKVESDPEMRPLKPMVSVAYAYRAGAADGGGESHWSVTDSVLYTNSYWGIARGGAGNVLYGDSVYTHVNLGVASTTGNQSAEFSYATVSGGYGNRAYKSYSTIGGGMNNIAVDFAWNSTISGGLENHAGGNVSTIGGGSGNYITADGGYGTIGGGKDNFLGADQPQGYGVIGGGRDNMVGAVGATVGGGYNNIAGLPGPGYGRWSTVAGGWSNTASHAYSTVGGGSGNLIEGRYSAIPGGCADTITSGADYSYLFGIGSKLTQDSTFMVDMPHIRFGDETDGYEFPSSDGSAGQVMATDGNGQLSWVDASGGGWVDEGTVVRLEASTDSVGIGTTSPNEQLEITGNLRLPATTATEGIIKVGADRFIHNYGTGNTFVGISAGNLSMTGGYNTANSGYALSNNTTGIRNTANGWVALHYNTTGDYNTANGGWALYSNTTGDYNTANGYAALYSNITGSDNTALGSYADVWSSITNATAIGYDAIVDASNKVRIGNTSVTSIGGQVGWTTFSDGRYKKSISENVPGLTFISKLKPVTYTMDVDAIDAALNPPRQPREGQSEEDLRSSAEEVASKQAQSQIVYTGFIAQEVEKAAQETGYDFSGVDAPKNDKGMYGLRYAEFVVPLVKAVQEQQQLIEELQKRIEELEKK